MDKFYGLKFEIAMSPEIFQKVEIWALIFLSLKFRRRFSIVTDSYALAEITKSETTTC